MGIFKIWKVLEEEIESIGKYVIFNMQMGHI